MRTLKEYKRKRDFKKTPEPGPEAASSTTGRQYLIQKHDASRLHYDFRLEHDGVLLSWAIPKGPSLVPGDKRLAVHVEDHPLDYGSFEGTIPEDQYGGGTVMLWDRGQWEPLKDPTEGLKKGHLEFRLHGEKLKGAWLMTRMGKPDASGKENWLLIKRRDDAARSAKDPDILEEEPLSVATGRSLAEIAGQNSEVWESSRPSSKAARTRRAHKREAHKREADKLEARVDPSGLSKARKSAFPSSFKPELATLVDRAPEDDEWVHEIKFDGYRIVCMIRDGEVRLITRNGNDWTRKFPDLARAASQLDVEQAILDGELVAVNAKGVSEFQRLQNAISGGKERLVYWVFDLPYCNGYDLSRCPLTERKTLLHDILVQAADTGFEIRYSDHIRGHGQTVLENACRMGMEGIVCKQADSGYEPKRSRHWLKVKCAKRQELVVCGYTKPAGSRVGFGALLLGYYDGDKLLYCGKVGTGFDEKLLRDLHARLSRMRVDKPPVVNPPKGAAGRAAHWVRPELVAEVTFTEWTGDGMLRHPSFIGLREDKSPRQVVRESVIPVDTTAEDTGGQAASGTKTSTGGQASSGTKSNTGGKAASGTKTNTGGQAASGTRTGVSTDRQGASGTRAGVRKTAADEEDTTIAGVRLTNPDRVLYPEQGITKLELARFYEGIADWILPHVIRRPLAIVRCPRGRSEKCFFQKHVSENLPESIKGLPIRESKGVQQTVMIEDLAGLIGLVQMGVLEVHLWGSRADDVERPDRLVFDLDPGPGVEWQQVNEGALRVRDFLDDLGLVSFVKTSGGKGLHVVAPIARRQGWDEIKDFSQAISVAISHEEPGKYLANMAKAKRHGRIFIDYLRNGRGATSIAPYSTRARPGASVSVPVTWKELSPALKPDAFNVENLPARLKKLKKDPWQDFFTTRQSITGKMMKSLGVSE